MKGGGKAALVLALPLLVTTSCFLAIPVLLAAPPAQAACTGGGAGAPAVDVAAMPGGSVAGYSGQQLAIAAQIMRAGKDKGLDVRGQTIGVMVGMGESSLTNIMHGDAAGPDSIGVFQQRANGAWGSLADRTNPYIAATNFFAALQRVPGWQSMTPTQAAHATQRNADPNFYTKFWDKAVAVVGALSGVPVTVTPGGGNQVCGAPGAPVPVGAGGAVKPTTGTLSSGFSSRINPVTGAVEHHNGQDIAAPCGTPIYAALTGDVIKAGPATGFGNAIYLDNGMIDGHRIVTWYGHEYPAGIEVTVGQHVTAGQEIGKVGSAGQSTGCHDHFEVHVDGVAVDPVPWMAAHGAPLG